MAGVGEVATIIGLVQLGISLAKRVFSELQEQKNIKKAIKYVIKRYNTLNTLLNRVTTDDEDQFQVLGIKELLPILNDEFAEQHALLAVLLTAQSQSKQELKECLKTLTFSLESCEHTLVAIITILNLKTSQQQGKAIAIWLSDLKGKSDNIHHKLNALQVMNKNNFEIVIKRLDELDKVSIQLEHLVQRGAYIGGKNLTKVFKATYFTEEVAVKELQLDPVPTNAQIKQFRNELHNLSKIHSQYIVQYFGSCVIEHRSILFVMELMKGDLYKLLHETEANLDSSTRIRMALDITRGLSVIHKHELIHRDICSSNILYNNHYHCKIADFGVTKPAIAQVSSQPQVYGISAYLSPKLQGLDIKYSKASDLYALGILLWELSARKDPSTNPYQKLAVIINIKVSKEIHTLIDICCNEDDNIDSTKKLENAINELEKIDKVIIQNQIK